MTRAHGSDDRLTPIGTRLALVRISGIVSGIPYGIGAAYRDAFSGRRVAWASPAIITVGAYVTLYGVGLMFANPTPHFAVIAYAVGLGLTGLFVGIGLGWNVRIDSAARVPVDRRLLTFYALALLAIGVLALVAYFVVIGYVPLFRPGLEQNRVLAAEEGGAPLRVLSLLALPGAWILIARAVAERDRRGIVLSALVVVVVATGFALTGNRSPAFTIVEVAVIVGLLAAGRDRLGFRGIAFLAAIGLVFVLGAGLFGAFRLASHTETYGPPVPGVRQSSPDYPRLTVVAIQGYLVVPVQNLGYTLDAIPDELGWRYGLTYLQPILTVLPGKQTTFDADLKTALAQHYEGGGTVPGVLGEAYANFGLFGWFVVPLLVGAAITALYRFTRAWTPESVALYAYAISHVSVGAALSGLAVASIFPYEAYLVLAFAVFGLPFVDRRLAARRG